MKFLISIIILFYIPTSYGDQIHKNYNINRLLNSKIELNNDKNILDFVENYDLSNKRIIKIAITKNVAHDYKQSNIKDKNFNESINNGLIKIADSSTNNNELIAQQDQKINSSIFTKERINFNANSVVLDQNSGVLIATGNVRFLYKDIELTCNELTYDHKNDIIIAKGDVSFKDNKGSFHNGDELKLNTKLTNIFMTNIYSRLSDGSQMKAKFLNLEDNKEIIYKGARYTPCECDFKNNEIPIWHFSTRQTTLNEKTHTIRHDGVTMHVFNIPVFYTPTFAHPDWTVKRKSGFLAPNISIGKETGITWTQPYYIASSLDSDYTITPIIYSKTGILNNFEYRKVSKNSSFFGNLIGGRVDTISKKNDQVISGFINFKSNLSNDWKTEVIIQDTSEDSFLRKYKLIDETILKSSISAEKLTQSSFSSIELLQIGGLSQQTKNDNSPLIAPEIKYQKQLNPPFKSSSGELSMSILKLSDDEGVDLSRYSNQITGKKSYSIGNGEGYIETGLSIDLYDISKNTSGLGKTGALTASNSYLTFGWESYIPKNIFNNLTILNPQIQAVAIGGTDHVNVVPNRDSADYRLDGTNLFLTHRPQGRDLILPGGRFDYGLTSFSSNNYFREFTGFFGQSVSLWGNNERKLQSSNPNYKNITESDYITRLAIQHSGDLETDWSARLDPHTFEIYESITSISQRLGIIHLSASHINISDGYLKNTTGAENLEVKLKTDLSKDWSLIGKQNYNLYQGDTKLLKTEYGLSYSGSLQNCMVIEFKYERETKTDPSIAPITETSLVFQFKYLGNIIESL